MQVLTLPVGHFEENCYVVWNDSPPSTPQHAAPIPAAVIDPGDQPQVILSALRERNLILSHILITHAHFDHLLAAPALQAATGAPVYVHQSDLEEGVRTLRGPVIPPRYQPPGDLRGFSDGDALEVGGLIFTIRHTPGHTPGACCLVCENVIFTGDTLFAGDVGRIDLPGGNPDDMRRTLAAIAGWIGDYKIYPGHGSATTLSAEQAENPYLQPPFRL